MHGNNILVVRNCVLDEHYGGDIVVLEFIEQLKQEGFSVFFLSLVQRHSHRPWRKLPARLIASANVLSLGNVRCSSVLVRLSVKAWLTYFSVSLEYRFPAIAPFLGRLKNVLVQHNVKTSNDYSAFASASDQAAVEKLVRRLAIDVLVVDYAWLTPIFDSPSFRKCLIKVLYGHELISSRAIAFRNAGHQSDLPEWTSFEESRLLRKADVILMETQAEQNAAQALSRHSIVLRFPRSATLLGPSSRSIPGRCLFVGSNAVANVIGLKWFLLKVWPAVLAACPKASLDVCGAVHERSNGGTTPTQFHGRVDDLKPYYEAAEVVIIPLLAGTGFKTKLAEAIAYACPVVSTTAGAAGAEELSGTAVLVSDSTKYFAHNLIRVLSDESLRKSMSAEMANYCRNNLEPKVLMHILKDALRDARRSKHCVHD